MTVSGLRARLQAHPKYRWFVLVSVGSGMMMAILDSSIVNIALPTTAADFRAEITLLMWAVTLYMVIQATFMPVLGRAGDIYGHKKVFITGLLVFTVTSAACAAAWNPYVLIVNRGLQAIGAATLAPMALSFVYDVFPPRDRPKALGLMGGIMGLAPVLGLTMGGLLVSTLGWRSVFFVNIPLCAIVVPAALLILKESEGTGHRSFDVWGGILLSSGIFCGLLGLSRSTSWGWTSPRIIVSFCAMAILLVLFILWEQRAPHPVLDLSLFRLRSLVAANITGFFSSGAMFGTFILLPFFFQTVLGEDAASTGLELAPMALMFVIVAPLGGRLTARIGNKITPMIGLTVAAAGYFILSRNLVVDATPLHIGLSITVMGIGLGLTMAPITSAAVHDVPPDKRGVASSLPNMFRFIGGSFTIAIVSTFLTWRVTSHLVDAGVSQGQAASAMAGTSGEGTAGVGIPPVFKDAFAASFQDVFLFAIIFVAAAFVSAMFIPHLRHRETPAGE